MSCRSNEPSLNLTTTYPLPNHFSQEEVNAAWASFSLRWKAQRWRRGCFSMSTVAPTEPQIRKTSEDGVSIPQPGSSRIKNQPMETLSPEKERLDHQNGSSEPTPTMVDLDLWNRYWKAYSDQYGDLLDGLAMLLDKTNAAPVSWSTVLLALKRHTPCSKDYSEREDGEVPEYIQTHFVKWIQDVAHQFGAIESMECNQRIAKLQFTGPEAAAAFQLWASGLSLDTFLRTRPDDESPQLKYSAPQTKALLSELHLEACLAPRNPTKASAFLKLSYGVLLPTAHVEALLRGLFDATKITCKPQDSCFIVSFKDTRSARLALHALQFSLLDVFNMSLEYAEESIGVKKKKEA